MIEASGPMNIFLAQIFHFGDPFLRWVWPHGQWNCLAEMLEKQEDCRIFVSYLRKEQA